MKITGVEKDIEVRTESQPISGQIQSGNQMYKWKVSIFTLDEDGVSTYNLPFIREVTFKLHETFPNPSRVVHSPPFELREQGWGAFDLIITIAYHDKSREPTEFIHDLNFNEANYTVPHTLKFSLVSVKFMRLLLGDREDGASSDSRVSSKGHKSVRRAAGKGVSKRPLPPQAKERSLSPEYKRAPLKSSEERTFRKTKVQVPPQPQLRAHKRKVADVEAVLPDKAAYETPSMKRHPNRSSKKVITRTMVADLIDQLDKSERSELFTCFAICKEAIRQTGEDEFIIDLNKLGRSSLSYIWCHATLTIKGRSEHKQPPKRIKTAQ